MPLTRTACPVSVRVNPSGDSASPYTAHTTALYVKVQYLMYQYPYLNPIYRKVKEVCWSSGGRLLENAVGGCK